MSRLRFDAEFVRRLRQARGWKLRDLERRTGLSNAYLSQLETGHTQNPGIDAVIAISEAFKVSIVSLLSFPPRATTRQRRGRP